MRPRLVFLVTHPMTARYLLRGQLRDLARRGFDVVLVTSPGPELDGFAAGDEIRIHTLPIEREISPLKDVVTLARLTRLLGRLAPDLVNASTPKAGLLGLLAARRVGAPRRLYTLRGLRLETARGARRRLLSFAERRAVAAAHRVIAVSPSLRRRTLELGLAPADKVEVLEPGASNGIDPERFSAPLDGDRELATLRRELRLPPGAPVIGFVGRLTRDKGLDELLVAFERLSPDRPQLRLLLVGGFEEGDPLPSSVRDRLLAHPQVRCTGFVQDVTPYYRLMDVLAFPSHREGFPNVPLEAAASGIPTVGFGVTGTVDAVVNGVTGRLVPAGQADDLAFALKTYLDEPDTRQTHGENARQRVLADFSHARVWQRWRRLYERLLAEEPLRRPSYPGWLARGLDLAISVPLLVLGAPILGALAALVRWRLGAPVLFRQERPGKDSVPFTLLKLRSMREAVGEDGEPLPDAQRLTGLGRWLRATSLDELPTLWNVLRGEMRLVGPRPLLPEYLDRYTPRQARRHEVRPGVTGWAQIHGRNALSWEEKFRLDVWYVDHRSLALDLRILARTLAQVVSGKDIQAEGHTTMPKFEGSPEAGKTKTTDATEDERRA